MILERVKKSKLLIVFATNAKANSASQKTKGTSGICEKIVKLSETPFIIILANEYGNAVPLVENFKKLDKDASAKFNLAGLGDSQTVDSPETQESEDEPLNLGRLQRA